LSTSGYCGAVRSVCDREDFMAGLAGAAAGLNTFFVPSVPAAAAVSEAMQAAVAQLAVAAARRGGVLGRCKLDS
jgi:hypothetical protein